MLDLKSGSKDLPYRLAKRRRSQYGYCSEQLCSSSTAWHGAAWHKATIRRQEAER